jgi:hypothetical protein
MILRQAFNALINIHSRVAELKRIGTPDLYSPIRISPSNFFRYSQGPSSMVIRGREFVIPIDSMKGTETQLISFSVVPTSGGFYLTYSGNNTTVFTFSSTAANIQTALRLISGLSAVTVTGNFTSGFLVTFFGVSTPVLLTSTLDATPLNATITIMDSLGIVWSPIIKRGDKIIDSTYGHMAIDEIIEMVDIGGEIIGYRCRCE